MTAHRSRPTLPVKPPRLTNGTAGNGLVRNSRGRVHPLPPADERAQTDGRGSGANGHSQGGDRTSTGAALPPRPPDFLPDAGVAAEAPAIAVARPAYDPAEDDDTLHAKRTLEHAAIRARTLSPTAAVAAASQPSSRRLRAVLDALVWVGDGVALAVAFAVGYGARNALPLFSNIPPENPPEFARFLPIFVLHVVVILTLFFVTRMYHQRRSVSRIDQARNVLGAVTIGAFLVNGLQEFLLRTGVGDAVDYPRSMFFYVWFFSIVFVVLGREVNRAARRWLRVRGVESDNLLIIGVGRVARDIAHKVTGSPALGYHIVGLVNPRPRPNPLRNKAAIAGLPVLGQPGDLPALIDAYGVEQVIIAVPDAGRDELARWIGLCRRGRVEVKIYPDAFAYIARELTVDDLDGTALLSVRDVALRGWKLSLKRLMDVAGGGLGLILLSPLLLLTALLVRLESPGAVFFTQERMGLDGRPFQMIKFRSMRNDAEKTGAGWTVKDDPRVTRIGRFMRRTSWDELPQLINVLMGDMSLVGPRPERPVYVDQFRQRIPHYMDRHQEKAGMTGWAQVNGLRGDTSIEQRTAYDLWYVENWSVWLDIKIIIRTVLNIVLRRDQNAY